MQRLEAVSPIRVFVILLAVVFAVEMTIMLAVESLDEARVPRVLVSLLDALLLVVVLWPMLWLFVVRPLRATIVERRAFLARTLTIQEEERSSLARDLHDELGQTQTAVLLGARSIMNAATLEDAKERAKEVARMAASTIESSRRIARGLSPGVLIDLGLAVAAERLCEDIALASGVEVERAIRLGAARVDPEIEIAAYRVLQEAMNNAVKHARATRLRVVLDLSGETLRLVVSDDGVGISAGAVGGRGGFGLEGMRQRVTLRNGSLEIKSEPQKSTKDVQGTTIVATFPLRESQPTP